MWHNISQQMKVHVRDVKVKLERGKSERRNRWECVRPLGKTEENVSAQSCQPHAPAFTARFKNMLIADRLSASVSRNHFLKSIWKTVAADSAFEYLAFFLTQRLWVLAHQHLFTWGENKRRKKRKNRVREWMEKRNSEIRKCRKCMT